MKNSNFLAVLCFLLMSAMFTSCEAIPTIFNAGMGVGIFAVLAVLMLVIFIVSRVFKRKK